MPETATSHVPTDVDYTAVTTGAGLFDHSERGKLAVTGADADVFLDSLLSNDIAAVEPGSGCAAALLTPKGRMLAEVRVVRTANEHWLDTDRPALQALFDALTRYRIGYRAELHKRTLQQAVLSLVGPGADELLDAAPAEAEHANRPVVLGDVPALAVRAAHGIDIICDAAAADTVRATLVTAGAIPVSEAAVECVRIESGRPRFSLELDETTMPQEAGIHERLVSYSKGCYVGQETVARLYWKGKPNRLLRGLRFDGQAAPGAPLELAGRQLGRIGSVARSPRHGPIGLALVRTEAGPGDVLRVAGASASATVCELPF